ncbi:MAG TPA: hypothetical protein VGF83_06220, partial [Actinomycetota bacterium]
MRTYVTKRLLLIVPTLFGVAAVVFVIMRVIPGDVTLLILGGDQTGRIDPQQLAAMRHQLGLDQPIAASRMPPRRGASCPCAMGGELARTTTVRA